MDHHQVKKNGTSFKRALNRSIFLLYDHAYSLEAARNIKKLFGRFGDVRYVYSFLSHCVARLMDDRWTI